MEKYEFSQKFLKSILENMSGNDVRGIMNSCAEGHYKANDMDNILCDYIGDLEAFIEMLGSQWGWIVEYDRENGIITANENKTECVCPILFENDRKIEKGFENMCYCSEGFAKKMFSKVLGYDVEVNVISSIIRGDKSCVYRISGIQMI